MCAVRSVPFGFSINYRSGYSNPGFLKNTHSNGKTLAGWPNPTSGFTQYKNTRRRHVLAYQLEPPCGPSFSACMERWPPRVRQKRQCVEAAESASDNIGKAGMVLLARERRCRHAVVAMVVQTKRIALYLCCEKDWQSTPWYDISIFPAAA